MSDQRKHEREEGAGTSTDLKEKIARPPTRAPAEEEAEVTHLARLLASHILSSKPLPGERQAMKYISRMRWEPLPEPGAFIDDLKGNSPSLKMVMVANAWAQLKNFFDGGHQHIYQQLEHLMDVHGMVEAFQAQSYIEVQDENSEKQELSQVICAPSGSIATRTLSTSRKSSPCTGNSNNSSSSSASSLSPGSIKRMRLEYQQHGSDFSSAPWVAPSGLDVDTVIAGHVLTLVSESPFHSYIITDPHTVLNLFTSEDDKQAVGEVLKSRTGDAIWTLPKSEEQYLSLYDKPPADLKDMLDMGCLGVMADARSKSTDDGVQVELPNRAFCSLTHRLVDQLFRVYERSKFQLQSRKSESWFRENLWANLHDIFNVPDELSYDPGEVHCQASARRKNRERDSTQTKQQVGRKADGLVSLVEPTCELLVVEATNIDNGPQGTKALNDTLKLSKMMKDMFDVILEKIGEKTQDISSLKDARERLTTYGLRFSAGSLTLYSLRKPPQGRYYVLRCEGVLAFPWVWKNDGSNTSTILTVISTLLALKHQLLQMAKQIEGWTKLSFTLPKPVDVEDRFWPATLTTPTTTPRNSSSTPSSSSTSSLPSVLVPPSPLRI